MTAANLLAFAGGAAVILAAFGLGWVHGRDAIARQAARREPDFVAMARVLRGMSGGRS